MSKLDARIRKLEILINGIKQDADPEPFVVCHNIHTPDELIGYSTKGEAVLRLPGESDSALRDRAASTAKDCLRFRDNNGVLKRLVHLSSIGTDSIKPDQAEQFGTLQ